MSEQQPAFRRRLLLNTVSLGAGNVWAMIVALAIVPLLLHSLGAVAFGAWAFLQTFSALNGWLSVAALGLGTATSRAVAHRASVGDDAGAARVASSALVLYATGGLAAGVLLASVGRWAIPALLGTTPALSEDLRFAVVAFAGQAVVDLVASGTGSCLEGLQRVDLSRLFDALRRTVVAVSVVVVARSGGGLRGVAVASLVASVVSAAVVLAVAAGRLRWHSRPAVAEMRGLARYGATAALLDVTSVAHRGMDRLIVGSIVGPVGVTLVEIATQVANGAAAIVSAASYTVISASSWLRARGDTESLRELLDRGTKYCILASMPLIAGGAVLSGPVVRLWVGDRYSDAAGLVAIALVALALATPQAVAVNVLLGSGHARAVVTPSVVSLVTNLGVSLIMVHVVGIVGVFHGTIASALVGAPFIVRATLRVTGLDGRRLAVAVGGALAPTAALLVAAGAVVSAPLDDGPTVLLGTALGGLAYVLVAYRWSLRRDEVAELRNLLTRPRS